MLKKLFVACLFIAGARADYDLKIDVELTASSDNSEDVTTQIFTLNYSVMVPEIFVDGSWLVKADLLSSSSKVRVADEEMILDFEGFEMVKQIDFILDKNWKLERSNSSESPAFDFFFAQALNFFVTKEYEFRNDLDGEDEDISLPAFSTVWSCPGKTDGEFRFRETIGMGDSEFFATLKGFKGDYEALYQEEGKIGYEFTGNAEARLLLRTLFTQGGFNFFEETEEIHCISTVRIVLCEK